MSKDRNQYFFEGIARGDSRIVKEVESEFYNKITSNLIKNNISEQDADAIFYDAIFVIYNKFKEQEDLSKGNFGGLLYIICKNIRLKKHREEKKRRKEEVRIEDYMVFPSEESEIADWAADELRHQLMMEHLNSISPRCQELLIELQQTSNSEELREYMHFKNANTLYQKKLKCLESIRKRIKEDPRYQTLLD